MNDQQGEPTVLKAFVPKGHPMAYLWVGLLVGAGVALLVAYPFILVINLIHDHFAFGVPFNITRALGQGVKPRWWPYIILSGLGGALIGAALGRILQRIRENRLRLDNLHHEFEIQVTTLRHHYKNLALGIQGFANRIKRKMTGLEEHFKECAREECLTYGRFYQDFDSLQQSVAVLEEASQRLNHTLGQELLFLRALTSNTPTLEPREFFPFLQTCIQDLMALRFREKDLRVEINGVSLGENHESLIVAFDPHIMEVILQNLLTNAMKNGDHIQIRVKDDNHKVRVEVEDNGPGMDIKDLQRQLKAPSRRQDAESTHLGLKVSLHLLEKCQGRLLALSQPGKGATFIVELPKLTVNQKSSPQEETQGTENRG
jgi:signal transduction histidine kinase